MYIYISQLGAFQNTIHFNISNIRIRRYYNYIH